MKIAKPIQLLDSFYIIVDNIKLFKFIHNNL